ncbi:hypothetical protein NDU88_007848 [Pleurodeles waltl]|uniref:Secreted protein n=1 Tax=Pleurodeles waltl TaxID=8319 RepID=A0AAV7STN4_PLEWA|nr:hypothetical protein NDU88_007848 [Pleurodeles waltl]
MYARPCGVSCSPGLLAVLAANICAALAPKAAGPSTELRSGRLGFGVAGGLPGTCAVIYRAELCSGAFERRSERLTWCAACSPITLWGLQEDVSAAGAWLVVGCGTRILPSGNSRQCWRHAAPCRRVCVTSEGSSIAETQRGRGFSRR